MLGKLGLQTPVIGFVAVLIFGTGRSLISVKVWARVFKNFKNAIKMARTRTRRSCKSA